MIYLYCYLASEVVAVTDNKRCEVCNGDCEIASDIIVKALNEMKNLDKTNIKEITDV